MGRRNKLLEFLNLNMKYKKITLHFIYDFPDINRVLDDDFFLVTDKSEEIFVNRNAEIWSISAKNLKELHIDNGYLCYKFRSHFHSVHRSFAMVFVRGYDSHLQVNHIDGNKLNNHITNLEWVTHTRNFCHSVEIGLSNPEKYPLIKNRYNKAVREGKNK